MSFLPRTVDAGAAARLARELSLHPVTAQILLTRGMAEVELLLLLQFLGVNDPPDWITPTTNAAPILLANGSIVGVRSPKTGVDLRGRVVCLSFPLDAVPLGSSPGNNRLGLLRNILNFLAPQPGSSSLTLDRDVYSVPGRAIVEVADADLQGAGQVNVIFASPLQTNGTALLETERKGLFRGSIIFASTNSGLPGTLRVQANNTVEARYFDASAARTLLTTATIGGQLPPGGGADLLLRGAGGGGRAPLRARRRAHAHRGPFPAERDEGDLRGSSTPALARWGRGRD